MTGAYRRPARDPRLWRAARGALCMASPLVSGERGQPARFEPFRENRECWLGGREE